MMGLALRKREEKNDVIETYSFIKKLPKYMIRNL